MVSSQSFLHLTHVLSLMIIIGCGISCRTNPTANELFSESSIEKIDLGFSTAPIPVAISNTGQCVTRKFRHNTNIPFDQTSQPGAKEEHSKFDELDINIETNMYWMNLASVIAYLPPAEAIQQFQQHFDTSQVTVIEGRRGGILSISAQAYIIDINHNPKFDIPASAKQKQAITSTGPATIVVFAGTQLNERADIITDARNSAKKMLDPLGRGLIGHVHSGFLDAATFVWPKILAETTGKNKPIFITGHSMGGALAVITAANYLAVNSPTTRLKAVYIFGAPRVGLSNFVEWYDQSMRNLDVGMRMVTIDDDPITAIPDNITGLIGGSLAHIIRGGWRHIGQNKALNEYVLWAKTRPNRLKIRGEDALQRLTLKGRHFILKLTQGIKDHAQSNYLSVIEQVAFDSHSNCGPKSANEGRARLETIQLQKPNPSVFIGPPLAVEEDIGSGGSEKSPQQLPPATKKL